MSTVIASVLGTGKPTPLLQLYFFFYIQEQTISNIFQRNLEEHAIFARSRAFEASDTLSTKPWIALNLQMSLPWQ